MKIFVLIIVSLAVGFSMGFRMKKRKLLRRINELELQIALGNRSLEEEQKASVHYVQPEEEDMDL